MTTDERTTPLERIDNHYAAMRAQVDDPGVRVEYLTGRGEWLAPTPDILYDHDGPSGKRWHRLAPAPKMVPLDQSDFLGPNRVTHLRHEGTVHCVTYADQGVLGIGGSGSMSYSDLAKSLYGWECSRDGGATWQACSKEAK